MEHKVGDLVTFGVHLAEDIYETITGTVTSCGHDYGGFLEIDASGRTIRINHPDSVLDLKNISEDRRNHISLFLKYFNEFENVPERQLNIRYFKFHKGTVLAYDFNKENWVLIQDMMRSGSPKIETIITNENISILKSLHIETNPSKLKDYP